MDFKETQTKSTKTTTTKCLGTKKTLKKKPKNQ